MSEQITAGNIKLSWHEGNRQWFKSIGYGWNRDESKLVQRFHYFGPEASAAILAAATKLDEWRQLQFGWPRIIPTIKSLYPGKDLSKPFWPEKLLVTLDRKTNEIEAKQPTPVHDPTIRAAKELYLAAQKTRVGLMGPKGLKLNTYNTIAATLEVALKSLDASAPASRLTYPAIEAVIHHHYRECDRERTALNYCRAFKSWLDWMENQPALSFNKPKGMDALFKLGTPEPDPYIPTQKQIKDVIAAAHSERAKLYMLLALNCGFTSVDVANLKLTEIVRHKGESFVWRRRDKTSHQNQFSSLHWLFPETVELLEKHMAPTNNSHGLALLTKDGEPLQIIGDGYKTRNVADAFEKSVKAAKLERKSVTFKSFRKFSATQLLSITKQDNMARMFLAQKVPGVLKNYVKDDFEQLTAALHKYHTQLKETKVI